MIAVPTYDFQEQKNYGRAGEVLLDGFFAARFWIRSATMDEQREGIDRQFTNRTTGQVFMVEYKTDRVAQHTNNAFVETVSVDKAAKPGWAYSSRAMFLIYYVPGLEVIYVLRLTKIRQQLARWKRQYPKRVIPNRDYNTEGLIVPLKEFEKHAELVISL